jgi:RNA polymerase subunit RPABC4/transcription elongation factor Spt4
MTVETTKICPHCGSTRLVALSSLNRKICADCKRSMEWYLETGQKSLLIKSRNNGNKC